MPPTIIQVITSWYTAVKPLELSGQIEDSKRTPKTTVAVCLRSEYVTTTNFHVGKKKFAVPV